jgi:glycosyltransferase involved in cell wall biosynthesis
MSTQVSVSIILPAINETYSLQQTVEKILSTCRKEELCEFFIVLCNKSTPACIKTAEKIKQQVSSLVPVSVYYQKQPFIGSAMREAFDLVKGTHVVMMSSDLETDPAVIPDFINHIKKSPDNIVTASRWIGSGAFSGYNGVKLIANFIFQKIISLLFWSTLTDATYGYRIFPVPLVQNIQWEETKHPFFLETALKPLRLGVNIDEIPAQWKARTEGESQNSFFRNFDYFRAAFKIRCMKKSKILRKQLS